MKKKIILLLFLIINLSNEIDLEDEKKLLEKDTQLNLNQSKKNKNEILIKKKNSTTLPRKLNDQDEPWSEKKTFEIDDFLKELDEFDCSEDRTGSDKEEGFDQLCLSNLESAALKPLGTFRDSDSDFWNYLNEKIYMPLAYNVDKKGSLSELINDLVFLDDKKSILYNQSNNTNYNQFKDAVLRNFETIEGDTSDMDKRQKQIGGLMTNILKDFHLYWNNLRRKDKIDRVKIDTKSLMKNLLQQYDVKEKFLFEITKTLVQKIKDAYGRFIIAHQSLKLMKHRGPNILAKQIISRYEHSCNQIKFNKYDPVKFVHEITFMLDLTQTYYISGYRLGYNEQKSQFEFEQNVSEIIKNMYFSFEKDLEEESDQKRDIKQFTATLLLKFKHVTFVIFKFHSISEIVNLPQLEVQTQKSLTIKVYFEVLDNMLLIPKSCINFLTLKNCAFFQANNALKYVASKYMLKRSVSGWRVFDYLSSLFKHLFSKANKLVWGNWTLFKNYFYQNLFAVMYNFKKKFLIKDSKAIGVLQDELGNIIDDFKKNNKDPDHINYGLIDQLDDSLYDEFLTLKADFDDYVPLDHNSQILTRIENILYNFLNKFQKKYDKEINDNFIELMTLVKNDIGHWKMNYINSDDLSYQVSELPIGVANLHPQVFHTVLEVPNPVNQKNGVMPQRLSNNEAPIQINLPDPSLIHHEEKPEHESFTNNPNMLNFDGVDAMNSFVPRNNPPVVEDSVQNTFHANLRPEYKIQSPILMTDVGSNGGIARK